MNLVLARACSNSCPYCFEAGEREGGKAGLISMENVSKLAAWARSTRLEFLSLLGGEPFLHPQLPGIVALLRQSSPGTVLTILTGGVFKTRLLDGLSPDDVGLVFNVNEPRDYKDIDQFARVTANITAAIHRGFRVILGFNVWRPDFDPHFMPNLAHRFARTDFRWTVANPQRGIDSCVIRPADFHSLADRCIEMLQEAAKLSIEARVDCPLPLCFFSREQLAWARQYHPDTVLRMGVCDPPLDVTPELEAVRCFPLSGLLRVKVTDFGSEMEIQDWFRKNVDSKLLGGGCFSECQDCPHFKSGRCYGGCLAWHEGTFDEAAEPGAATLALCMHDAIEAGKPELAIEEYEKASFWSRTAVPSYLAAAAAIRLSNWDKASRFAAYAMNVSKNLDIKKLVHEAIAGIPRDKVGKGAPSIAGSDLPGFVSSQGKRNGTSSET